MTSRSIPQSFYRIIKAFLFGGEYLNCTSQPVALGMLSGANRKLHCKKARDTVSQRNHLWLWLAPFTIDGLQVWVGQVSRDIGIKMITQMLVSDDPCYQPGGGSGSLLSDAGLDLVGSRFHVLASYVAWGIVHARSNEGQPTGDHYLTDGLRLVLFVSEPRRALDESTFWIGSAFRRGMAAAARPAIRVRLMSGFARNRVEFHNIGGR